MNYKELIREQKQPLSYKIAKACEAIEAGIAKSKHAMALAFSGGKDSTVLWQLIRENFPADAERLYIIFGNTGVEYPESLHFAREIGKKWGGVRFCEVTPLKTESEGLKYEAQKRVLAWVEEQGRLDEILKPDGKLKSTETLERICPPEMYEQFRREHLVWPKGTPKSYFWCADQYGWPLLGKAFSRLGAHRINIDCFLKYSDSKSQDAKTLAYYEILEKVKISQMCCHFLKKEPSEAKQAELNVDVIFKGLMAAESRTRATNFLSRGYIFESSRPYLPEGDPFCHCNPLSIWTDDDIWEYTTRFHVPYSGIYDMGWQDGEEYHKIPRNGCMGCGTDLLFPNNHLSILRKTHPKAWHTFMHMGMGEEIIKLQREKRGGQMSVFDYIADTDYLIKNRPCVFDRIDKLVMEEVKQDEEMMIYDSEET